MIATAAVGGALACQDRHSLAGGYVSESPSDNQDSASVRIRELWRLDAGDALGTVGGLATWEDGTIWITAGSSEAIWDASVGGRGLRRVRGDGIAPYSPGRTLHMVQAPGGGMLILSYNGATYFGDRSDQGIFREFHRFGVYGAAVFANGDYVVSHGQYPGDSHVKYAIHRYDHSGLHIASWHPAFPHDDWRIVTAFSGGPVALTQNGDLLFSERAPFRITRYFGGMGDSSAVVVEDETVVSSSEMESSISPDGSYGPRWTQSVFLDEMNDGTILNVVRETSPNPRSRAWRSLWVAVSPNGQILARTRFDKAYWKMSPSGPDRYLAVENDGWVVELQVSVVKKEAAQGAVR